MDAKYYADGNYVLTLDLSEAKDINELVDNFRHWDMITGDGNQEPMAFMLQLGRDCGSAIQGFETTHFPIERGGVVLSKFQLHTLSSFLKACVEADGKQMSWIRRNYLKLASKTLRNRIS